MKKLFFIAVVMILLTAFSTDEVNAQNLDNRFELGLRLNSNDNPFDVAVDGVYALKSGRRLHGNIGFGDRGLGLDLLHDWVFTFDGNERFAFYAGLGGSLYFLDNAGDDIFLGITGEVGFEYRFEIPLTLGLDYRPAVFIIPDTDTANNGLGLNIRYRF